MTRSIGTLLFQTKKRVRRSLGLLTPSIRFPFRDDLTSPNGNTTDRTAASTKEEGVRLTTAQYVLTCSPSGIRLTSPAGENLIEDFVFFHGPIETHCRVDHCAGHVLQLETVQLVTVQLLRPGDTITLCQPVYGRSARASYYHQAVVREVHAEKGQVVLDREVPEHIRNVGPQPFLFKAAPIEKGWKDQRAWIENRHDAQTMIVQRTYDGLRLRMSCRADPDGNGLTCSLRTRFLRPTLVGRMGLALMTRFRPAELFLKDGRIAAPRGRNVECDHWLGKGGGRFVGETGEWLCLHNSDMAMVEYVGRAAEPQGREASRRALVLQAEHLMAQRSRLCGLGADGQPVAVHRSIPEFAKGEERSYEFRLFIGPALAPAPRFTFTPGRYRASHVWTEHADNAHMESHRAAYYGSEAATSPKEAVGGFVQHGHVVTKSIFYKNHTHMTCYAAGQGEPPEQAKPMVGYADDADFQSFLDDLHALGHEICLHTCSPEPSTAEANAKALREVTKRYRSRIWIDHNPRRCRVCIGADGLDENSPHHMTPTWKRYGIRFFWSDSSEDYCPMERGEINMLHGENGTYTPTPLYHPQVGAWEGAVAWASNPCPPEYFSARSIKRLILEYGISIHRSYYPYVERPDESLGFLTSSNNSTCMTSARFERVLRHMQRQARKGDLLITTMSRLLNYWLGLESVRLTTMDRESFVLENRGEDVIPGCSFLVQARHVFSPDVAVSSRRTGHGDIMAWFDFPPGTRARFIVGR